jgi:hypothetical protein
MIFSFSDLLRGDVVGLLLFDVNVGHHLKEVNKNFNVSNKNFKNLNDEIKQLKETSTVLFDNIINTINVTSSQIAHDLDNEKFLNANFQWNDNVLKIVNLVKSIANVLIYQKFNQIIDYDEIDLVFKKHKENLPPYKSIPYANIIEWVRHEQPIIYNVKDIVVIEIKLKITENIKWKVIKINKKPTAYNNIVQIFDLDKEILLRNERHQISIAEPERCKILNNFKYLCDITGLAIANLNDNYDCISTVINTKSFRHHDCDHKIKIAKIKELTTYYDGQDLYILRKTQEEPIFAQILCDRSDIIEEKIVGPTVFHFKKKCIIRVGNLLIKNVKNKVNEVYIMKIETYKPAMEEWKKRINSIGNLIAFNKEHIEQAEKLKQKMVSIKDAELEIIKPISIENNFFNNILQIFDEKKIEIMACGGILIFLIFLKCIYKQSQRKNMF